jgi:hypothetical protein
MILSRISTIWNYGSLCYQKYRIKIQLLGQMFYERKNNKLLEKIKSEIV